MGHLLKNINQAAFGTVASACRFLSLLLLVAVLSGCSGNCNAGGNAYGGKVLCKALDF